jgi:hypothetical protein
MNPADGGDAAQDRLIALRAAGAGRLDPARFHYLEALARRIAGQPEPVRALLEDKLRIAVAEYAGRLQPAAQAARPPRAAVAGTPLNALNAYIRAARPAPSAAAPAGEPQDPHELASARRFRRAWSSRRTQDQLEHAVARKPANAGPLNSHMLVLQSLALMGELSTDYLRHFLQHVETLQWLERAGEAVRAPKAKAAKAGTRAPRGPKKAA